MDSRDIAKATAASVTFVLLVSLTFSSAGSARVMAGQVAQRQPLKFAGVVTIGGQPVDPGSVNIDIAIWNAARQYKLCGSVGVKPYAFMAPNTGGATGYEAILNAQDPDCVNPNDRYDFYVNGVWAANQPYLASDLPVSYVNLNVPEVALVTPKGVHLVWFSGVVIDSLARPAAPGVTVTATSMDSTCPASGTGTTRNLYWAPKIVPSRPIGINGFYSIGIPFRDQCADRPIFFKLELAGTAIAQQVQVTTPPYGRVVSVPNLVLPVPR